MTDNSEPQLTFAQTANREKERDFLLVPYAAVNLARILTGCYLRGTATGVNVPDAQSTSDSFLLAFENEVPLWATDLCKQDDSDAIVICLDPKDLKIEERAGRYLVACPVPTANIVKIVAETAGKASELASRIGRMPDVPWSLFDSGNDPSYFESQQSNGVPPLGEPTFLSNLPRTHMRGLDAVGGVVAAHLSALRGIDEFDGWIQMLYHSENLQAELGENIYKTVSGSEETLSADNFAWKVAWYYLASRDARQGFSSEGFLTHAEQKESEAPTEFRKQYQEWVKYCKSITSAERDFPINWKDSKSPAMRAILVFLLAQSREKLASFFEQYGAGKRVRFLAESIAAHFETIKRIPVADKAPGRTALDALSNALVTISRGEKVSIEIGRSTFNSSGHVEQEVRIEGAVIASRSRPIDLVYTELFAKARRVSMSHGYDTERELFFIEEGDTSGTGAKPLRLYVRLEDIAGDHASQSARFFTPVATFSSSKSPPAARLKAFLEIAWSNELAVGLHEHEGKYEVLFFWSQIVDTFDAVELVCMLDRFRSALRAHLMA